MCDCNEIIKNLFNIQVYNKKDDFGDIDNITKIFSNTLDDIIFYRVQDTQLEHRNVFWTTSENYADFYKNILKNSNRKGILYEAKVKSPNFFCINHDVLKYFKSQKYLSFLHYLYAKLKKREDSCPNVHAMHEWLAYNALNIIECLNQKYDSLITGILVLNNLEDDINEFMIPWENIDIIGETPIN